MDKDSGKKPDLIPDEENALLAWLARDDPYLPADGDIKPLLTGDLSEEERQFALQWLGLEETSQPTTAKIEQALADNLPDEATKIASVAWLTQCRAIMATDELSINAADLGVFVTTSTYTTQAIESAGKSGKLFLVDGEGLINWHINGFSIKQ